MRWRRWIFGAACGGILVLLAVAWAFRLPLGRAVVQSVRWAATPALAFWHRADLDRAHELAAASHRGGLDHPAVLAEWHALANAGVMARPTFIPWLTLLPMVHAPREAEGYERLRERFRLLELVEAQVDEFSAMLAVGRFVAGAWDHGRDEVPGGPTGFDPVEVLDRGRNGARYHCAVAARTLVHCATAVGFVGRTATIAADGYSPQHTVCELWSNQFAKWFVLDADFGVVYLHQGVPLSAFELCHHGPRWRAADELQVRALATPKPSLPPRDMLPSFASVHIDLRTDWRGRPLPRGSPAGGDLATWHTARAELGTLLTRRRRVDDPTQFDWQVNHVRMRLVSARAETEGQHLELELAAYAPQFRGYEWCVDDSEWRSLPGASVRVFLPIGTHRVQARVCTGTRWPGPPTSLELAVVALR